MNCTKCGKWAGAHATLPGQTKDHLCMCERPGVKPLVPPQPATPAQAEELAKKAVADYLNACHIATPEQVGNYLMKLASVAGVLMANAEGSAEAALRLEGTARFILKTMPKKPAKLVPVQ